jgi:two-component system cell cycle sensor histidine kinase/response regulator CckA
MNPRDPKTDPERLAAIADLLPKLARDSGNMLAIIKNYAAFAAKRSEDARLTSYLEGISKAGSRADRIVRVMRDLSPESAAASLPEHVVDAVRDELVRIAGDDLDIVVQPHCPNAVAGGGLEQVLIELCCHASSVSTREGRIRLALGPAGPEEQEAEGLSQDTSYVRVSVSWEGATSSDDADRSLEPRPLHGARLLACALGGAIRERSDAHGTSVDVLLPALGVAERRSKTDAPRGRGERVIVVDGIPTVRALTVHLLDENGYDVVDGVSAGDVLAALGGTSDPCDLLVTEVYMGRGLTGPELAARVRELRPQVRILYMSGYHPPDVPLDDTVLVAKPFTADELLEGARRALDAPPRV